MFAVCQNGLKTDRDELFFDFDREVLRTRMETFYSDDCDENFKAQYRIAASSSYDIEARRNETRFDEANIRRCLYRPFDVRWLYYDPKLTSRPAEKVMSHMIAGENIALITMRQTRRGERGPFLAARGLINKDAVSLFDIGTAAPLYLYDIEKKKGGDWSKAVTMALFESSAGYQKRRPNFNPTFLKALAEKLRLPQAQPHGLPKGVTPEDVFHYAYAVFHSPTYRARYAEFLKIDFPRLPLTSDVELFRALAGKGAELVALHLMESAKLIDFITEFPAKGSNEVEKIQYTDKDQRVWINADQYFADVPKPVWEFPIGGYQVCDRWLKDRKGRKLSYDDIEHYQKIVVALNETTRLMTKIDEAIPAWPIK